MGHKNSNSSMKCLLVPTGEIADSREKHICNRGCLNERGEIKTVWVPVGNIIRDPGPCTGIPLPHEWREWLILFAERFGITNALAICRYIRWRMKGSPLDELPPNVPAPNIAPLPLSPAEVSELFPGEDPKLLGNRIKALTDALGIPTCGGCEERRQWLNKAHEWLRGR